MQVANEWYGLGLEISSSIIGKNPVDLFYFAHRFLDTYLDTLGA